MEKTYPNISYFFMGVLICCLVGFHLTYTVKFPTFEGLSMVHHFHGLMLMSWFGMLIIQPFLIRYKKFTWHRKLGKVSYVLVPLILYSIFLVTKVSYHNGIAQQRPANVALGGLALDIPDILAFGLFYVLAMVNSKNSAAHMRYMVGTSLLMIGPGLGRALIIFGGIPFPVAVTYTMCFAEFITIVFIAFDYFKGHSVKPYLVVLATLVALQLCWEFQMASWWQAFGKWFVQVFF